MANYWTNKQAIIWSHWLWGSIWSATCDQLAKKLYLCIHLGTKMNEIATLPFGKLMFKQMLNCEYGRYNVGMPGSTETHRYYDVFFHFFCQLDRCNFGWQKISLANCLSWSPPDKFFNDSFFCFVRPPAITLNAKNLVILLRAIKTIRSSHHASTKLYGSLLSLSLQFCLKLKSLLVGNGLDDKLNSLTRWLKATFHWSRPRFRFPVMEIYPFAS